MMNIILYCLVQKNEYGLKKLVDDLEKVTQDDTQGIHIQEYDDTFLKATYWQRKWRKEYRYNLDKKDFEFIEEEVVNTADFGIQIPEGKLLVFGNKLMAQKIITLIGIASKNSYSITEFVINIENLVKRICKDKNIELIKMKLVDITLDKGLLVNCVVNLLTQDNPTEIVMRYISNIIVISFKFEKIVTNVTVYKSGKFSISKIDSDDKDEMIQKIIKITC
ncbi:hypothetical protein DS742_11930 [Lacrimispora amygdalina]|uniref:Uncharacterized protein n=1 Tax=Lacrimispora amygdalina TaxID=253257 RepID=A0A3E2ND45_9FIRM|nr:hypothetical protein [Clostridium indicum]RFZ78810.1 hypothetical protein DS742_11930 [Clostridium indicum]